MFLALADDPKDRGTIVAQGGGKVKEEIFNLGSNAAWVNLAFKQLLDFCVFLAQALIPLALEGTDSGKIKASHALAKIAAISNPELAFPGERVRTIYPLHFLLL